MTYVISGPKNPTNFPTYTHDELGTFFPGHQNHSNDQEEVLMVVKEPPLDDYGLDEFIFKGDCNKSGNGDDMLLKSPFGKVFPCKPCFDCTNNVVEY